MKDVNNSNKSVNLRRGLTDLGQFVFTTHNFFKHSTKI